MHPTRPKLGVTLAILGVLLTLVSIPALYFISSMNAMDYAGAGVSPEDAPRVERQHSRSLTPFLITLPTGIALTIAGAIMWAAPSSDESDQPEH